MILRHDLFQETGRREGRAELVGSTDEQDGRHVAILTGSPQGEHAPTTASFPFEDKSSGFY
jgi:hypothetical protein